MSEEEKQAIEDFRKLVEAFKEARQEFGENEIKDYIQIEKIDDLEKILQIIEKQQEEIEKLKTALKVCENELIKERKNRIKLQELLEEGE